MSGSKTLKQGISAMLDGVFIEHPKGHQKYSGRYEYKMSSGITKELVFERHEKRASNIWVRPQDVDITILAHLEPKDSFASKLNQKPSGRKNAKPTDKQYGRFEGIRLMPILGMADLVYFTPKTLDEAWQVISSFRDIY